MSRKQAQKASVEGTLVLEKSSFTVPYNEVRVAVDTTYNGHTLDHTLVSDASVLVHVYASPANHICIESLVRSENNSCYTMTCPSPIVHVMCSGPFVCVLHRGGLMVADLRHPMFFGNKRKGGTQMLPCASLSVPFESGAFGENAFVLANQFHVCVVSGKDVAFVNLQQLLPLVPTNFARMAARVRISSKGEARFDEAVTNETQLDSLSDSDDSLSHEDGAEIKWAVFECEKTPAAELSRIYGHRIVLGANSSLGVWDLNESYPVQLETMGAEQAKALAAPAVCVLSVAIPMTGMMSFSFWQCELSQRTVAVRCKDGAFVWSLPRPSDFDVFQKNKDGEPLNECKKVEMWPTPIKADEIENVPNMYRSMALNNTHLLLGDCVGIVSAVPLEMSTQDDSKVVAWGQSMVVQLNSQKDLTKTFLERWNASAAGATDKSSLQKMSQLSENPQAVVFLQADEGVAYSCSREGWLYVLSLDPWARGTFDPLYKIKIPPPQFVAASDIGSVVVWARDAVSKTGGVAGDKDKDKKDKKGLFGKLKSSSKSNLAPSALLASADEKNLLVMINIAAASEAIDTYAKMANDASMVMPEWAVPGVKLLNGDAAPLGKNSPALKKKQSSNKKASADPDAMTPTKIALRVDVTEPRSTFLSNKFCIVFGATSVNAINRMNRLRHIVRVHGGDILGIATTEQQKFHFVPKCGSDLCVPLVAANKMPHFAPFRSTLIELVGHRTSYIYVVTRHSPHSIFMLHRVSMDTKDLPMQLSDVARLAWHFVRRPLIAIGMVEYIDSFTASYQGKPMPSAAQLAEMFPIEKASRARPVHDSALRSSTVSQSEASEGGSRSSRSKKPSSKKGKKDDRSTSSRSSKK